MPTAEIPKYRSKEQYEEGPVAQKERCRGRQCNLEKSLTLWTDILILCPMTKPGWLFITMHKCDVSLLKNPEYLVLSASGDLRLEYKVKHFFIYMLVVFFLFVYFFCLRALSLVLENSYFQLRLGFYCGGFSCCSVRAPGHMGLSSCGLQALELQAQ